MSDLIRYLERFNRKERFHLLVGALGEDTFRLDADFRERLGELLRVTIPHDAFVAMDYHLDWINVAVTLVRDHPRSGAVPGRIPKPDCYAGTQVDVGLLVAFDAGDTTHLVLIEAKMDTGWSNEQAGEKAERLGTIFGDTPRDDVAKPYFVLLSPTRPQQLNTHKWPQWMHDRGEPLWLPPSRPDDLLRPTQADEDGNPSAGGEFIAIRS